MAERVGPEGSRAARLVLIGEAPGRWEHIYGRPFVGPSYQDKLKPWWHEAGLARDAFYITNVLDYQPSRIESVPEGEMRAAFAALHDRLAALDDPWLIVPTGNYALYALTGHGRVAFHQRDGRWLRPGVTEYRGSVLSYEDKRGRTIKVIPTIHPAATFRTPGYEWVCQADWRRIAADAAFRELRLPKRSHLIMPRASEAVEWIRWTRSEAAKRAPLGSKYEGRLACSLDVETPKKEEFETRQAESKAANGKCRACGHTKRWHENVVRVDEVWMGLDVTRTAQAGGCRGLRGKGGCSCIGFAPLLSKPRRVRISSEPYLDCIGYSWDASLSLTIPTAPWAWREPGDFARVREAMAGLHADPNIDFGGQNFAFDAWWCATEGMPIANPAWDLMKMHKVQRPWSEWNDLAFQASLDTREPYWKDEAKDPDSVQRYAGNREAFYTYNGKDNCAQRELLDRRVEALRDGGRLDYYERMEAPIEPALVELSLVGIRPDLAGRAAEHDRTTIEAAGVAKEITAAAGVALVKKAVSVKKMKEFLYGPTGLRLPEQFKKVRRDEKIVSTDVVAIRRLMERFPGLEQLQTVGRLVLRHRRLMKVAGSLSETQVAPDGRIYGFFKQDTGLGRLSCEAPPKGVGTNLQNQDRKLRQFFVADEE